MKFPLYPASLFQFVVGYSDADNELVRADSKLVGRAALIVVSRVSAGNHRTTCVDTEDKRSSAESNFSLLLRGKVGKFEKKEGPGKS